MPNPAVSRQLADRLEPGVHHFDNRALRDVYGVSRVTAKSRTGIAQELERLGLEVLSDPAREPLTVRKVASHRAAARPVKPARRVWWQRPWVIGGAAALVLLLIVGALGDSDSSSADEDAQAVVRTAETTPPPTTETVPAQPVQTFADAEQAVEDENFSEALLIAGTIGGDDRNRIRRKISRTLARQVRVALRSGNRSSAKRALTRAARFGGTPQIRSARVAYRASKVRAAARAEARRVAADAARQRAAARRAARQAAGEAEEAAEALEATPSYDDVPQADTSGPSSTNWCGKRDGDGDGIYCE